LFSITLELPKIKEPAPGVAAVTSPIMQRNLKGIGFQHLNGLNKSIQAKIENPPEGRNPWLSIANGVSGCPTDTAIKSRVVWVMIGAHKTEET